MTPPSEKLAGSLDALRSLQERSVVAVRARDLPRSHRERLVRHGFLLPVMKGWYVAGAPGRRPGDSTAWYASFWSFCAGYLRARFGAAWCLSPEQSLLLHAGNRTVPAQLLVRAPRGRNRVTRLAPRHVPAGSPRRDARRRGRRRDGRDARVRSGRRADRLPDPVLPAPSGRCAGGARPRGRRVGPAARPPRRRPRHGRRPPRRRLPRRRSGRACERDRRDDAGGRLRRPRI